MMTSCAPKNMVVYGLSIASWCLTASCRTCGNHSCMQDGALQQLMVIIVTSDDKPLEACSLKNQRVVTFLQCSTRGKTVHESSALYRRIVYVCLLCFRPAKSFIISLSALWLNTVDHVELKNFIKNNRNAIFESCNSDNLPSSVHHFRPSLLHAWRFADRLDYL